jgi:hypothetical protein
MYSEMMEAMSVQHVHFKSLMSWSAKTLLIVENADIQIIVCNTEGHSTSYMIMYNETDGRHVVQYQYLQVIYIMIWVRIRYSCVASPLRKFDAFIEKMKKTTGSEFTKESSSCAHSHVYLSKFTINLNKRKVMKCNKTCWFLTAILVFSVTGYGNFWMIFVLWPNAFHLLVHHLLPLYTWQLSGHHCKIFYF